MLTSENVKEIDRIFMRNGGGKDVVAKVAQQYGITESFAGSIAKALVEKRGPNVPDIAESAPDLVAAASTTDMAASRKTGLAAKLVDQVRAAEAKPINECSIQELQALAAAAGGEAGMFGG